MRLNGRYRPGAAELVFGVVLATGLIGGRTGFLNDPGTFWHLRLGREIVRTGGVPRADGLTYSRLGAPWVDQSWAFDALLALLVDHGGWSAAVAATALALSWIYWGLARWLLRDGTTPLVAVVVAILAAGIGAIHFLARPHLFTFGFVLLTLRVCRDFHERGGRSIALLPPMMVVWGNVHGGFLAGPLIVATAAFGHAISGRWDRQRARRLAAFAAVLVLCVLAPLVNPYGVGLYGHVRTLLVTSRVTDLIAEYQPSPFGKAEARVLEWVVLALIALPFFSRGRPSRYDLAHALVWLHLALGTVRHAPLFALAVAPVLAKWLDGLLAPPEVAASPPRFAAAWPFAASLALTLAVGLGVKVGGLDPKNWPIAGLEALNREPVEPSLFHEQDWGGMIEEACRPSRRAYLDDRFELFGRDRLLEYVGALQGGPDWDAVRDRQGIGLVWVRPKSGLARRLLADRGWEVVHRDEVSILFRRAGGRKSAPIGDRGETLAEAGSR